MGIDASPWPLRSPPNETQLVVVAIDQVQSRAVAITTDPVPPLDANEAGELLAVIWHLSSTPVGAVSDVSDLLHATTSDASATARADP